MATPFLTPCTVSISGITGAGKTSFVRRLLRYRDEMFDSEFISVTYFYTIWQSVYGEMQDEFGTLISFVEGIPDPEYLKKVGENKGSKCVILDDLMNTVTNDKNIENLFSRGSHHFNITLIYINQNCFAQGRCSRSIALNVQYTVLMANPRVSQIAHLGNQFGIGPNLKEAFINATAGKRFSYIVVLAHPSNSSGYQMIANIFPDDSEPLTVYSPVD